MLLLVRVSLPPRSDGVTSITRARRFPLQLPLLFRAAVGGRWRRAKTLAISRDGLSFTARNKLPIGTRLDMRFFVGNRPVTSEVACRGRVVRLKQPDQHSRTPTYGVTIDSYRFCPTEVI